LGLANLGSQALKKGSKPKGDRGSPGGLKNSTKAGIPALPNWAPKTLPYREGESLGMGCFNGLGSEPSGVVSRRHALG